MAERRWQGVNLAGRELKPLRQPFSFLIPDFAFEQIVAFPRAGRRFGVFSAARPEIRLLDETTQEEWTPPLPLSGRGTRLEWSPEGTRLLSTTSNGTARLWDAITGLPLGQEFVKRGAGGWTPALYPDGEHIALPNPDGTVENAGRCRMAVR